MFSGGDNMHIPDGILSPVVLGTAGVISVFLLTKSVSNTKKELEQRAVPVMGVMAAFIFAAQMINFPLLGAAASGHLLGGALVSILFGFWPASLVMATVVTIQAIIFQDGGITALGVNLFNMAFIAPAIGTISHSILIRLKVPAGIAAFITGWFSVFVVAIFAALELGFSGVVSYQLALKGLLSWHVFIGIGEGIITSAILPFAKKSSFERFTELSKEEVFE